MTEKTPVIQKTYDYTKFHFIVGNRGPLSKTKIKAIANSILEDDQTPFRPILVDKTFGVVDGQHTIKALEEIGYPVYFVQNGNVTKRTMALLNAYTTKWSTLDWLNYYIISGQKEYIQVKAFMVKYALSVSQAINVLVLDFHDTAKIRVSFREGTYKITQAEAGNKLMEEIAALRPHFADEAYKDQDFYRAYLPMRSIVEFSVLKGVLETHNLKIRAQKRKKDYMRQFEDILNFKKSKNLIRLF